MPDNRIDMLTEAVARNCAAVVSLPSAGLLRHCKSRFLGETPTGLWMEAEAAEHALINELIAARSDVGIAFKRGHERVAFTSTLLEFDVKHSINAQTTMAALLVAIPREVKAVQRRNNYRVRIIEGSELQVRVWRIAPRVHINDRPMPSQQVAIHVRDLSLGGMAVMIGGNNGDPPKISVEDRLRIELQYGEISLLIEGRMRQPSGPQPTNGIATGIRFNEMAGDLEGRQKLNQLTRIVGALQRHEVRRAHVTAG